MTANTNDFLQHVGIPGTATTMSAPGHSIAGTSITVGSTTNWPTDTGVTFAIDTYTLTNGVQVRNPGTYSEWTGVVTGSTTIGSLIIREGTDQAYPAGTTTRVYIPVSSTHINRMVDGLLAAGITQAGGMGAIAPISVVSTGGVTGTALTGTSLVNTGDSQLRSVSLETIKNETQFDYIVSGGVWSGDAYASTRNGSMTALVAYQAGRRGTVSAVTAHSFTASKDTYVDILNTAGVFTLVYTEVTNNAASPALAANSIRLAIVVTGASNIAAATSINQGQEDRVLPIASSIAYTFTDSLGNIICPRDPNRKILGYRQITTATFSTAAGSAVQITGLTVPVIVPTGRKVKVNAFCGSLYNSTSNIAALFSTWDGVVGVGAQLSQCRGFQPGASGTGFGNVFSINTPSTSSKTYNAGLSNAGAGTATLEASSIYPAFIMVELD